MDSVKKVLILSVRAGAGHIRAAQAVEQAIRRRSPVIEVRHLDMLSFSNPLFAKNFSAPYESLAMGLSLVVANPIPGQEERNAVHVLESGAGVWAHSPSLIVYKAGRILENPELLTSMRAAARRAGNPDAAARIADELLF